VTALQAGAYLSRVLTVNALYRARWTPYVRRASAPLSAAAVSRALAMHLWDTGERPDSDTDLPRKLRDLVGRALSGQVLTPATLQWFVEAFDIDDADHRKLTDLLLATGRPPLAGTRSGTVTAQDHLSHRTLSLCEHHYLGPDGWPDHHDTLQVIEATVDGLERHRCIFETAHVEVEPILGGRIDGPIYPWEDGLHAVDIVLVRPLRTGETTTLKYRATFGYPSRPAQEFRRGALSRINNVNLRLQFHPQSLPRSVSFRTWPFVASKPSKHSEVTLEADHSVQRHLAFVEDSMAGFTWEWPPAEP
jgi:hypothetical protein